MKKFLLILLSVFSLLLIQGVSACSMARPTIYFECSIKEDIFVNNITCFNENCTDYVGTTYGSTHLYRNISGRLSRVASLENNRIWIDPEDVRENYYADLFDLLNEICIEDLSPIKADFYEQFEGDDPSMFLSFKPYSDEDEQLLIIGNSKLERCHYSDYSRVEDWLVSRSKVRDYCYLVSEVPCCLCPYYTLDRSKFISHLKELRSDDVITQAEYSEFVKIANKETFNEFLNRTTYNPIKSLVIIIAILVAIVIGVVFVVKKRKS